MSKPFDATSKALIETRPADWPAFLGVAARSAEAINADISTVTGATDKVLIVRSDGGDRIQHFEFQSGPDAALPLRVHWYNALLEKQHKLPVDSVVVLLQPAAHLQAINGKYERHLPGERKPYLRFQYRVLRVWKMPAEAFLRAGISVLPLAPISAVDEDDLPAVIARMKRRLDDEADRGKVDELWMATRLLLGMRYPVPVIDNLLQGVRGMKESTTYQAILEEGQRKGQREGLRKGQREGLRKGQQEGRYKEALTILLRLGRQLFEGEPSAEQRAFLNAITDTGRLEDLIVRAHTVKAWAQLLALAETSTRPGEPEPEKRPAPRRKKP